MSERIWDGLRKNALYKSTYTLLYFAQSPDLNIIENVWHRIKRELQHDVGNITSVTGLKTAIRRIWENLPVDYVQNLYKSIPRRISAVLRRQQKSTRQLVNSLDPNHSKKLISCFVSRLTLQKVLPEFNCNFLINPGDKQDNSRSHARNQK